MSHVLNTDESRESRRERAKAKVRLMLLLIRADTDGLDDEQTAAFLRMHRGDFALPPGMRPIGYKRATVWRLRVHLGLVSGHQHWATGKRTGRRDTKATLVEAAP